jgi:hypothetical protein
MSHWDSPMVILESLYSDMSWRIVRYIVMFYIDP